MKKMTTRLITMASAAMITAAAISPLTVLAEEVERTESTDTKTETSDDPAAVTEVEGDTTTTTDAGPVVTTTTTQTETTVNVTGEDHSKSETATHAEFVYSETEDATRSETEKVLEDAVSEQTDVTVESEETDEGTVTTTTITTREKGAVTEKTTTETSGESKILTHVDEEITDATQKSNVTVGKANVQDSKTVKPEDYNVVEEKTTTTTIKIQGDVRIKEATLDDGSTVSDTTLSDGTVITNGQVTLLEDSDKNATYVAGEKVTTANDTNVQSAAYKVERNQDGSVKLDENGKPMTTDVVKADGSRKLTNPMADGENLSNPLNQAIYVANWNVPNPAKTKKEAGTGAFYYTGEAHFDLSTGYIVDTYIAGNESGTRYKARQNVNVDTVTVNTLDAEGNVTGQLVVPTNKIPKDQSTYEVVEGSEKTIHCATAYARGKWERIGGKDVFTYIILTNSDLEGTKEGDMLTADGSQVVLDTKSSETRPSNKFSAISGQMSLVISDDNWEKLSEQLKKTPGAGMGITTTNNLPKIFFLISQAEDGTWRTTGETVTEETARANGGHYFVPYVLKEEADTFVGPYQAGYHYDGYLYFLSAEVEQTRDVVITQDILRTVTESKIVVTTQDESESVWTQTVLNRRSPEEPMDEKPENPTEPEEPSEPNQPSDPTESVTENPVNENPPQGETEHLGPSHRLLTQDESMVLGAEREKESMENVAKSREGIPVGARRVMTGDEGELELSGIAALLSLAALWIWALIKNERS